MGIESPEDELALLTQEQSEPVLNPQGMQQLAQGAQSAQQAMQPPASTDGAASLPQPVASEIQPNVQPVQ